MLWFSKPDRKKNLATRYFDLHNVVLSNAPLKKNHPWEQGTADTEYMIKPLTVKGNIILHPFMGSGSTGEAALNLGRKFVGIEINKKYLNDAAHRLALLPS